MMQPICECICSALQFVLNMIDQDNMILFVNGLNDCYEGVKNQILLTEPLPTLSKVYSFVLQNEQQNEAYQVTEMNAFNLEYKKTEPTKKFFDKKRNQTYKKNMVCECCKKKGHGRDICFKLMVSQIGLEKCPSKNPY